MKLLLDECISTRLAPLLADAGHDVIHVSDRDLAGHGDDQVLAAARDEGRVLSQPTPTSANFWPGKVWLCQASCSSVRAIAARSIKP